MQRGQLFEYAILYHPKTKKDKVGDEVIEKSVLVKEPSSVLAVSPEEVSILAARAIPDEYLDKLDCVEIIVRPFGAA